MKFLGRGRPYLLSRAVEDPIDATFELSEKLQDKSTKLNSAIKIGIFATIVLTAVLLPSLFVFLYNIFYSFLGRIDISPDKFTQILVMGFFLIILISISATALLFQVQVKRFYKHIFQRYQTLSNLKITDVKGEFPKQKKDEVAGKHRANPILATLDLVEEAAHRLSKITHLIEVIRNLFAFIIIFMILNLIIYLINDIGLLLIFNVWQAIAYVVIIIIFIPSFFLIDESKSFLKCIQYRHEIIDEIKFEKIINVPSGKDPLKRLIAYLESRDPFIKSAVLEQNEKFQFDVVKKDKQGVSHKFDAYLKGVKSDTISGVGMEVPTGRFSVFITVYKKPLRVSDLENLQKRIIDICDGDNSIPLRVIILQWQLRDLDDEVYDYALENPIVIKDAQFHLQIVSEDGDAYSFIPNMAYEKEVD
jgi:ABC-type multidrug transport system fused ATPase/permease subunit